MDSQKLRNRVDMIMKLYMQNFFLQIEMEGELQDKIFNLIAEEATGLIESSFNEKEVELYAQASDLLLSIPAEKIHALQTSLGISLASKIEKLVSDT